MYNYKFTTMNAKDFMDRVDKKIEEGVDALDKAFSAPFWNIIEHPEFPFISVESPTNNGRNFPPYNIIELASGQTRLDIAVAGFTKDRLTVELDGTALMVKGTGPLPATQKQQAKPKYDEKSGKIGYEQNDAVDLLVEGYNAAGNFRKQGISNAAFVRSFTMQPNTKVDGVRLQDGILSILVSTVKPEKKNTTKFKID